jgi:hypothetical protein
MQEEIGRAEARKEARRQRESSARKMDKAGWGQDRHSPAVHSPAPFRRCDVMCDAAREQFGQKTKWDDDPGQMLKEKPITYF